MYFKTVEKTYIRKKHFFGGLVSTLIDEFSMSLKTLAYIATKKHKLNE